MKKTIKKHDVNQCALYKCQNKRRLEKLLNLQKYDLDKISKIIDYHSFQIDKKDANEKRDITAPCLDLKLIQARILKLIEKIERPTWLISGEKGKCYIDNGRAHLLSDYVLTVDIKKFYDNCKREYVFRFFKDYLNTSGDIAGVLTDIVTYKGGIPTGCPTSQLIAYYAYQKMFVDVNNVAHGYGCIFTLYVDDMTFSSVESFDYKKLGNEIDIVLRKYDHRPKYRKIKYYSKKDSKPITGTIVNASHQLEVPNNLQKKVYDNFRKMKKDELQTDCSAEKEKVLLSLKGQLQAVKNIDSSKFPEIDRVVNLIPIAPQSTIQNSKYRYMK